MQKCARPVGYLDTCRNNVISGWAWLPDSPNKHLTVTFKIDGIVIGSVTAKTFRPDLKAGNIGKGSYGFSFRIPRGVTTAQSFRVDAYVINSDERIALFGSPIIVDSSSRNTIIGDMSLRSDGLLDGWAYSEVKDNRPLKICIEANGRLVKSVEASSYRGDLVALGSDGCHGFQCLLPADIYADELIELKVYEESSKTIINKNPLIISRKETYFQWCADMDSLRAEKREILISAIKNSVGPCISILLPVYDSSDDYLTQAITSVLNQSYKNWQLCIVDDCSTSVDVKPLLHKFAAQEPRISLNFRGVNGHISIASNSALEMAQGKYIALLDHDDMLHPDALLFVVAAIATKNDLALIFSDEDKCDENGMRYAPYFKKGWDSELIFAQNSVSHLGVYKTEIVKALGGFRAGYEGSQDYDLTLRISQVVDEAKIHHIPEILYHWRAVRGSTALQVSEKKYARSSMRKALRDFIHRSDERGELKSAYGGLYNRFKPALPKIAISISVLIKYDFPEKNLALLLDALFLHTSFRVDVLISYRAQCAPPKITKRYKTDDRVKLLPRTEGLSDLEVFRVLKANATGVLIMWIKPYLRPHRILRLGWLRELVAQSLRSPIGLVVPKLESTAGVTLSFGSYTQTNIRPDATEKPGYRDTFIRSNGLLNLNHTTDAIPHDVFMVQSEILDGVDFSSFSDEFWTDGLGLAVEALGLRNVATMGSCLIDSRPLS